MTLMTRKVDYALLILSYLDRKVEGGCAREIASRYGLSKGFVANILAVMFIFVGSWYPTGFPILRVWNEWMLAFTAVSVISGITIYLISQRTRRGKTDVELLGEGAAPQEIAGDTSMA